MANNLSEALSSMSFAASSSITNASGIYEGPAPDPSPPPPTTSGSPNLEILSLSRLSSNLEKLLLDSDFNCTDAEIVVDGIAVGVHRCILAARSQFFREYLAKSAAAAPTSCGGKLKYNMSNLVSTGRVGYDAFMVFLGYLYTGKLRTPEPEVVKCADQLCAHDSCRPPINLAVEITYASYVFQITDLVSLFQRRLNNFVDKVRVEDVIPIISVAFHSKLNYLVRHCVERIARSDLDNTSLEKELPHELVDEIKLIRRKSLLNNSEMPVAAHEKSIGRVHRALDSDDVELVKMLLTESNITLDDAYGLHYAVAYCDAKVVSDVLELDLANVNLKNERGYSPLHMAAMRREPAILVSLLNRGARASEVTADGQCATTICRRLTRLKDYNAKTKCGQESNKDKVCIGILEGEIRRTPTFGDEAVTSPLFADNLQMQLIYLENRVAFARLHFPTEAKVAMAIAHADTTSEFADLSVLKSSDNLKEVDLNETPSVNTKRLRDRVDALAKTVELGRRFFPHCSELLDKFMEEDLSDLYHLGTGTADEQQTKRMRLTVLKSDVQKAYKKDKAKSGLSGRSSSSPSSSLKVDGK